MPNNRRRRPTGIIGGNPGPNVQGQNQGGNRQRRWRPTWEPSWKPGTTSGNRRQNQGGGNQGGGGKGGNKGGKGGGNTRDKLSLSDRALNDVNTAYQPMLDAIRRAQEQATAQYTTDSARVEDIYGALLNQLQPLGGSMTEGSNQIASDLTGQIGGLANLLGSTVPGVPQSEITAGTNSVGTTGSGALQVLANDLQRNLGYNTSAQRQGGIEQMTASRNYLQDLQNLLDEYSTRSLDLQNEMPGLITQRLSELRDQQFQRRMSKKEFGLRKAAAQSASKDSKAFGKYLKGAIGSSVGGGGGGGGGGGAGGGGGGGGGGGWQPSWKPGGQQQQLTPARRLVTGEDTWADLSPKEQDSVRDILSGPTNGIRERIQRAWEQMGNQIDSARAREPSYWVSLLKQIARDREGGGGGGPSYGAGYPGGRG